jgi:hypothetical protein
MGLQCRYDLENPMVMIVVMAGGARGQESRGREKRDEAKIFCARKKHANA